MFRRIGLKTGIFINRLNRFISEAKIDGKIEKIYVPNTGRLSELAIPGNKILLEKYKGKYRYKLKYIFSKDFPVMINSSHSNRLFEEILKDPSRSPFPEMQFIRSEPTVGSHRFDFLMQDGENKRYIELKSCTLGHKNVASFPDAISSRASKHVRVLSDTGKGTIVFLVLLDNIDIFVPNYHTDFEFYITLKECSSKTEIRALGVKYDIKLNISSLQEIPVHIPDVKPEGVYALILFNDSLKDVKIGERGHLKFPQGYYLYTGSGGKDIFNTIRKQRDKTKQNRTPLDHIKGSMKIIADIPIVTNNISEFELASSMSHLSPTSIEDFTSGKCIFPYHLFYFRENPMQLIDFWDKILEFRFGQYELPPL